MINLHDAKKNLSEAIQLIVEAKYDSAIEQLKKVLPVFKKYKAWEELVQCRYKIADALWKKGKSGEALQAISKTLAFSVKKLGKSHPHTAGCMNIKGISYFVMGDMKTALHWLVKSLKIRKSLYGLQHPETASNYANIGNCLLNLGKNEKAEKFVRYALSVSLKTIGKNHLDTAKLYNNLGVILKANAKYNQAISCYNHALKIRLRLSGENHPDTASSYLSIGLCYRLKGDFKTSLEYVHLALKIRLETLGEYHPETAQTYTTLGDNYLLNTDYDQAILYFRKGLHINLRQPNGEQHIATAKNYNSLGTAYLDKANIKMAYQSFLAGYKISVAALGKVNSITVNSLTNIGNVFVKTGQFQKAMTIYRKVLYLRLQLNGKNHPFTAAAYINIGNCYRLQKNYRQAIRFQKIGIKIYIAQKDFNRIDTALALTNLGECYALVNEANRAMTLYNRALRILLYERQPLNPYLLPNQIVKNRENNETLHALRFKAKLLLSRFQQNHENRAALCAAIAYYMQCDQLIDHLRKSYLSEGSKIRLAKEAKSIYRQAIFALWTAIKFKIQISEFNEAFGYKLDGNCIELAHYFIEKSKGVLLLLRFKDMEAKLQEKIPERLLSYEYKLVVELNYLERLIDDETKKPQSIRNQKQLTIWQNEQFNFKLKYDRLIHRIERRYPEYAKQKYKLEVPNLIDIQFLLPENQAVFSYFIGLHFFYVLILTEDSTHFIRLKKSKDWKLKIENFICAIQDDFDPDPYIACATSLFAELFEKPLATLDGEKISSILILPDEALTNLPFEALLTKELQADYSFSKLPYLLHQYYFSYHLSATLWVRSMERTIGIVNVDTPIANVSVDTGFIGFAPVYANKNEDTIIVDSDSDIIFPVRFGGKDFPELPNSDKEIMGVDLLFNQHNLKTKLFLGKQATRLNFIHHVFEGEFVLVSAHGHFNPQRPELSGIVFSSESHQNNESSMLYLSDIYSLNLNTFLMVLSCCETGLGKHAKGEGVMGINRAFLYAGVQNLVYTIFKVLDISTPEFTIPLFKKILSDKKTCFSLQFLVNQTKREMALSRYAAPKHWAGFIFIGTGMVYEERISNNEEYWD